MEIAIILLMLKGKDTCDIKNLSPDQFLFDQLFSKYRFGFSQGYST